MELTAEDRRILQKMLISHGFRELQAWKGFEKVVDMAPHKWKGYVRSCVEEERNHYLYVLDCAQKLGLTQVQPIIEARHADGQRVIPEMHSFAGFAFEQAFGDYAGLEVFQALKDSCVEPYAEIVRMTLDDEVRHDNIGTRLVLEFLPQSDIEAAARDGELEAQLISGVRCLGKPGTPDDAYCVARGIKTKSAADIIAVYCATRNEVLAQMGECARALYPLEEKVVAPLQDPSHRWNQSSF